MAGASLITSTMKWALSKLPSLIPQAASSSSSPSKNSSSSAEQEFHKLERTLKRIHATLADAEERDIIDKSEQLRLSELREVAYDVEDLIDEYEYEVLRVKVEARRKAMAKLTEDDKHDKVFDWNSYCPAVSISDDMMHRTRAIRERFEEITDDWKRIELREKDGSRRNAKIWKPMETTSFFEEDTTFGRKDEKNEIIEWLLQGGNEPRDVSVLAIIGMGGIGKTTLAQLVYNDPIVSKHFDLRAWVYVSEDFDVANILRNVVYSFSEIQDNKLSSDEREDIKNMSLDLLYRRLKKQSEGKRFLIVLDDVWSQKWNLWRSLKSPLSGVGSGKIIVTTRNRKVARIMQITTSISLEELPLTDCISLFERIALQGRDHNSLHKLSDIGESIVKKCKGLPLAVKVLASILSFEEEEEKWNDVLESDLWEDENENNEVLPILKLSYDHMPIELRPCFMYLSLFRKDDLLEKKTVVQQWMSQGFLHANRKETEEDVGDSYFNELLQRSILQYSTSCENRFVMHDLIHDLAQFVAKDEYLLITTDKLDQITQKIDGTIRHIAIYLQDDSHKICLKALFESKQLRTLMLHNGDGCSIAGLLHNLACLRTLILDDSVCLFKQARKLPDAFRNLKHLRFLKTNYCVSALEPICSLYHLQTFDSWSVNLELCEGVGDLTNLRHLKAEGWSFMHHEVGWLTNLRTLSHFEIGPESWQCKLRDLKDLTNLRGRIKITGLGNIRFSDSTVSEAYLEKPLQGIEKLELSWSSSGQIEMDVDDERSSSACALSCFRHHPNLVKLRIDGYPGATFPTWFGDASFLKLKELYLMGCDDCTSLPTLGQLPALNRLRIQGMGNVEVIGREFLIRSSNATASVTCFPSLKSLTFEWMDEWKEWNGVEHCDFPQLSHISIDSCPKLRRFPSLHSLTRLEFEDCCDLEALANCCLPMLQTLCINEVFIDTLAFPDGQSLRAVKVLIIVGTSLCESGPKYIEGLGNLTSLERLEIRGCHKARISGHEQLPPNLRDVQIEDSPKVERWYKNHVLGCGGDGSADTQQTDSDTEEEEEPSEEENDDQTDSDTEDEEELGDQENDEQQMDSDTEEDEELNEEDDESCGERGNVDGTPSEESRPKRRKI